MVFQERKATGDHLVSQVDQAHVVSLDRGEIQVWKEIQGCPDCLEIQDRMASQDLQVSKVGRHFILPLKIYVCYEDLINVFLVMARWEIYNREEDVRIINILHRNLYTVRNVHI